MAIIKYTSFGPYNSEEAPVLEIVKSANMVSYNTEYVPKIAEFIKNLSPKPGCIYILSNALGGSEVWGSNNNGDLFPAAPHWGIAHPGKEWGYETFVHFADVFRQHRNEKSKGHPSYGKLVCSAWNPRMWRVETVAEIPRGQKEIEDIESDLDNNKPVAVSMGCRIPFDECSVCGHRARVSSQHCEHLKTKLKQTMPDGLVVAMINYYPIFFDQSFVRKGADPAAWAHSKVGEGTAIINQGEVKFTAESETLFFSPQMRKVASSDEDKEAAMYKEIGGEATTQVEAEHGQTIREFMKKVRPKLQAKESPMDKEAQEKIASEHSLSEIWSTMHFAGIDMRPDEFQYMALKQAGAKNKDMEGLADDLWDKGIVFKPEDADKTKEAADDIKIDPDNICHDIYEDLVGSGIMEKRSYLRPFLMIRVSDMCKEAMMPISPPYPENASGNPEHSSIIPVLIALAGAYGLARNQLAKMGPSRLMRWIRQDPRGHKMALSSAGALDQTKVRRAMDKDLASVATVPIISLIAAEGFRDIGHSIGPRQRGEIYWESPNVKTADVKGFLGRSMIGVPLAYGTAGYYDAKEQVGIPSGNIESLVQNHPIATGSLGALGAGAIIKRRRQNQAEAAGQSITKGRANDIWGTAKKWIGGINKRADLLEPMALNPAFYDIDPAVADRIIVDAFCEMEKNEGK